MHLADWLERLEGRKGAAIVLGIGFGAAALIGLVIGLLARVGQQSIDVPLYDWLVRNYRRGTTWTEWNQAFTQLGDPLPSLWQTLAATVVFAVIFGRRWWIPTILLPLGPAYEYGLQQVLGRIVDRGHPDFGSGTYFSGGSARFVVLYGLILFLALLRWPSISRPWRIFGAIIVAILAFIEGVTRLYLLKHWPTDVPAGWLIGTLILGTIVAATQIVVQPRGRPSIQSAR